MKEYMDFILHEEKDMRIIFRFFPSKSVVEFRERDNKDWDNIWNIIYEWKIIEQRKKNIRFVSKTKYYHELDSSRIEDLPFAINQIIEDKQKVYLRCDRSVYMKDADLMLIYNKENNSIDFKIYEHISWEGNGKKYFLFSLSIDKAKKFATFINNTINYFVKNSEPNYLWE